MRRFERMLAEETGGPLENLARLSQQTTRRHFGRTMRLFAPLYLSNECVNNCSYCGFTRDAGILRTTLAIEVGPMEDAQYAEIVAHGAEGLIVYQETYDRATYQTLHTAGPKKNFDWRLDCLERAYAGGSRRIGIGALFGLADWKSEALALCGHLDYLYKHCWKAQMTVAFPRMRPYAGNYEYEPDPALFLPDKSFVRLISVFRILFPQVGIVVSTREPAELRDAIATLGVTHMSAGVRTEPGGYTGAGSDDLHLTVKGRRVELEEKSGCETATEQFQISDTRSAEEIAIMLRGQKLDPVWKDWDEALMAPA